MPEFRGSAAASRSGIWQSGIIAIPHDSFYISRHFVIVTQFELALNVESGSNETGASFQNT